MKKIRVTVQVFDPTPTTEYEDLPDNWDEMSGDEQYEYLDALALEALGEQAGSGAEVIEVDDNGKEI